MSDYQIMVLEQAWMVVPVMLLVSSIYWRASRSFMQSAHGGLVACAFLYAVVASAYTSVGAAMYWYVPLTCLLAAALTSAIYSAFKMRARPALHLAHISTALSGVYVYLIGGMAISHDWL